MRQLQQRGTGRIYPYTKILARRADMVEIGVEEAPEPDPVPEAAEPEQPAPQKSEAEQRAEDLESVRVSEDKDELEAIGREYGVEVDRRFGTDKIKRQLTQAIRNGND